VGNLGFLEEIKVNEIDTNSKTYCNGASIVSRLD
jgi:hypothetical protein